MDLKFRQDVVRWLLLAFGGWAGVSVALAVTTNEFVNFESSPVHPLDIDPSGTRLAVANLPEARVGIFDIGGSTPRLLKDIPVGLDPVSVRWRTTNELWVVCQLADAVNIIDLAAGQVNAQLPTGDAPADVVFAGQPLRAFVSVAGENRIEVFAVTDRVRTTIVPIAGERPKALGVTRDGAEVCVAISESGNATTILAPFVDQAGHHQGPSAADLSFTPSLGKNPAPNLEAAPSGFVPPLNPALTNRPPLVSIIVRKDSEARWRDGEGRDWTEYISGTNAALSGRLPGWDLPDRDLAFLNVGTSTVRYATGLMNLCNAVAVNPSSGLVAVVGIDGRNETRFERQLKGVFVQSKLALVDPTSASTFAKPTLRDLNPHLTYALSTIPAPQRLASLGDPHAAVWNLDGSRCYVAGQGSGNVAVLDAAGARIGEAITLGEFAGPSGLALDGLRGRLFVFCRFSSELVQVDLNRLLVTARTRLPDPTPEIIRRGRRVFYDTQLFSGLGQASCASCHQDGRFDRLAWDLGDPSGQSVQLVSHVASPAGARATLTLHPMKGPMVTQTLQDIIGHEPFHWRADRPGIEDFGPTFTNLQAADRIPLQAEMEDFKGFLASLTFPPNPRRNLDNTLPVRLELPGHQAFGRGNLAPGAPLPAGNAQRGLTIFRDPARADCGSCHTLPTGLGPNAEFSGSWRDLGRDTNGHAHVSVLHLGRAGLLPFKVSALRSVAEKLGFDRSSAEGTAGFGLFHDGSVDTLSRFLHDGFRVSSDQDQADLIAFLLAFTGSDLPPGRAGDQFLPPGVSSRDVPAGVGRQAIMSSPQLNVEFNQLLALARSPPARVELIVQRGDGGWWYDAAGDRFLGNASGLSLTTGELLARAGPQSPLLAQLALLGSGLWRAIDRDGDGFRDADELAAGSDPTVATDTPLTRHPYTQLALQAPGFDSGTAAELSWLAQPGVQYQVQARTGLDEDWAPLGQVLGNRFVDTQTFKLNFPMGRFYRLVGGAATRSSAEQSSRFQQSHPELDLIEVETPIFEGQAGETAPDSPRMETRRGRAGLASTLIVTNFHRLTLANLDLRQAKLPGMDFSRGVATNALFDGAELAGSRFLGGRFPGASFTNARLDAADLREADFTSAQFGGARMRLARASQATLKSAVLTDADLRGGDFGDANLSAADLRRADLRGASFDRANLDLTDLRQTRRDAATRFDPKAERIWHLANEGGAGENLRDLDLSFAVLNGADLHGAVFGRANLTGAELIGCDLRGCVLNQAQLEGALLHLTRVDATTIFSGKFQLVWGIVNNFASVLELRGANLDGAWMLFSFIEGIDFSGASLQRCSLTDVSARAANFTRVRFTFGFGMAGDFRDSIWTDANLSNTDFTAADLSGADLRRANLTRVTFRDGNLTGADLTGAFFSQTIMPDGSVRNR